MDTPSPSALARIMTARDKGLTARVEMTVSGQLVGLFTLFGRGVAVDVHTGGSVQATVCGPLGIDPGYLTGAIQTIFLNGRAVDGMDTARVSSGSVLALSAAMPGLVGATMRRGGRYAALRNNITHAEDAPACGDGTFGTILVKLFNQVARDLAADFLKRGVWVEGDRFADFIGCQAPESVGTIFLDGAVASARRFLGKEWSDRAVWFSGRG